MSEVWISFKDRLPSASDANVSGKVELLEVNGMKRLGLWDWIPPTRNDAADLWQTNGFKGWRPATP